MDEIRRIIGVCPQHDILWERLTGKPRGVGGCGGVGRWSVVVGDGSEANLTLLVVWSVGCGSAVRPHLDLTSTTSTSPRPHLDLTGREHLELFSRLKNVPVGPGGLKAEIDARLEDVLLTEVGW